MELEVATAVAALEVAVGRVRTRAELAICAVAVPITAPEQREKDHERQRADPSQSWRIGPGSCGFRPARPTRGGIDHARSLLQSLDEVWGKWPHPWVSEQPLVMGSRQPPPPRSTVETTAWRCAPRSTVKGSAWRCPPGNRSGSPPASSPRGLSGGAPCSSSGRRGRRPPRRSPSSHCPSKSAGCPDRQPPS